MLRLFIHEVRRAKPGARGRPMTFSPFTFSPFPLAAMLGLAAALSGCEPWVCDRFTCSSGCCDSSGTCIVSGGNSQCGLQGAACASCETCFGGICGCGPGLALVGGKCACTSTSCTGCCETSFGTTRCLAPSSQSTSSCGVGGETCGSCAGGASCGASGCMSCGVYGAICSQGSACCSSYRCEYSSSSGGYRCTF